MIKITNRPVPTPESVRAYHLLHLGPPPAHFGPGEPAHDYIYAHLSNELARTSPAAVEVLLFDSKPRPRPPSPHDPPPDPVGFPTYLAVPRAGDLEPSPLDLLAARKPRPKLTRRRKGG